MVTFSKEYPDFQITQQLVAQIPWGHNILLLEKVKCLASRIWYIKKTIENGWSRSMLSHWIDCNLYQRQGKTITNFQAILPPIQSDLADQTLKDPFVFDFLTLRENYLEKELEESLVKHIQEFLLELGQGFAFVGRQYKFTVENSEYAIDLLFYHLKLRCYCVIELKASDFQPEFTGKLNFYLSAIDDLIKHPEDNPTIGILTYKGKNAAKVKYALRRVSSPIGVSTFETELTKSLPKDFAYSLPTMEEIEEELERNAEVSTP